MMNWMYQNNLYSLYSGPDLFGLGFLPIITILPLVIWSLVWKGWALWLAARRGEMPWFIALLIINTVGILEIFYIFVIAKQKDKIEDSTRVVPEEKKEANNNQ